jgi:hypothetical protein
MIKKNPFMLRYSKHDHLLSAACRVNDKISRDVNLVHHLIYDQRRKNRESAKL